MKKIQRTCYLHFHKLGVILDTHHVQLYPTTLVELRLGQQKQTGTKLASWGLKLQPGGQKNSCGLVELNVDLQLGQLQLWPVC